ncbi:MAG: hypothetical protein Ct9H300mP1_37880 [Planctomycetaceae bacterium]|nr:MAG: hypothetical protein Ct9H300mP1_37880 [Planctomycetaceae bacterium]
MARGLFERGVPFVTVNSTGWDSHQDFPQAEATLSHRQECPASFTRPRPHRADRRPGKTALFDETLVVVMGEFGRTPKINSAGGRDHWPNVFSVLLAGGE